MNSPIVIIYTIIQKLYDKLYDKWIDIILAIIIGGISLYYGLRSIGIIP